ncbi:ABC transporter permease [Actinotalea sp. BY-33]|uniref:ABC transporter permease n=1 Tax=Actinotalea soli TaxID=2819234 RepID=A0A939LQD7_9CELL|nr:ABC transporter permease [Actinotalea soli]
MPGAPRPGAAREGTAQTSAEQAAPAQTGSGQPGHVGRSEEDRSANLVHEILSSSWLLSLLALVVALAVGGVLIAAADEQVQEAAGYLFARPTDFIGAAWSAVSEAYVALFHGAVFDGQSATFTRSIRSVTETLTVSTPLILAGLGVALAFRASLFNIGAQGQIIMGATFAAWVGFTWHLPVGVHVVVAVLAGILGGALWGAIPGFLRARTGAHEVIVTIMLNYIAVYLISYLLITPAFQRPGSSNPVSPLLDDTALYPLLLGSGFRLHAGFLVAIAATAFVWWLLNRSTVGFRFRAVGLNPHAARTAGIKVEWAYVLVMIVAGGLAGLAGTAQVMGTEKYLTAGIAASFGFDAITVALLGRSRPIGVFFAGLLFGALRAGGVTMQARTGTPIDIVLVVQSVIVLLIAAPPLVRAIFRLPAPNSRPRSARPAAVKEAQA